MNSLRSIERFWERLPPGTIFLALWALLILGLQPGALSDIVNPRANLAYVQIVRGLLPVVAGAIALAILAVRLANGQRINFSLFSPLGFTAVYAFVGLFSAMLSPKGWEALYWSAAYLSVPLVIWIITWNSDPLQTAIRLVKLNWLIILLALVITFFMGIVYLGLGKWIFTPSRWIECQPQGWFDLTSQTIRDTAVGRYAAISGIIAISQISLKKSGTFWGLIFVISMILLLFSGARTAMVGFGAAVPVILVLRGDKKMFVGAVIATIILVPTFWATDGHNAFLNNCIWRTTSPSEPSASPIPAVVSAPSSIGDTDPAPIGDTDPAPNTVKDSEPIAPVVEQKVKPDSPVVEQNKTVGNIPDAFFTFSGRTMVWSEGWKIFKDSPLLGRGFQADRFLLGTHMHNSMLHAMVQTGTLGTIPLLVALVFIWTLMIRAVRNLSRFPMIHKSLIIQLAGILTFFSVRTFSESTGAFFGVDWLLLAPVLVYLQMVNQWLKEGPKPVDSE